MQPISEICVASAAFDDLGREALDHRAEIVRMQRRDDRVFRRELAAVRGTHADGAAVLHA